MDQKHLLGLDDVYSVYAGNIVYPPGGSYGPRKQQDIQLVLVHSGSMEVTVDGVLHQVLPGQVLLLKPQHQEWFKFSSHQETWHRWISVHVPELTELKRNGLEALPNIISIPSELNRTVELLLSLQTQYEQTSNVIRSIGYGAIELFMAANFRSRQLQDLHPSILLAKDFINSHFHEELSLRDIASQAGVSPEHLVRLFRLHEDTTPMKYVWNYRVLRANELLIQTGLRINEITERCGFKSTYHFARVMKKQTGRTPTEIRLDAWHK
ncbi:hypothetical protein SY83_22005 [Paenibacillus swuensis]|uniref:HTH araC/xylS-type domain-containing protein n=1 Tax=Paenibacillus swuensis TaxID=1178515 RepID=A0A172TNN9_9BACL|nr:AraC family transcriptional regulator [Paenibacillus swuensis]ANE48514.1 hypothetical protein SY83_22005 [Paenibacillus swuensis]